MSDKDEEQDLDRVQKCLNELGEYFDSVQIFTTRYESETEGGTVNVAMGTGNWFARYGQVQDWIIKKEEETRKRVNE